MKILKTSLVLSILSGVLVGCNNNGATNTTQSSTKTVIETREEKLAVAQGAELVKFYNQDGYKIDFADSLLVGPQYYAAESNTRPNIQYDLKILKVSDNSFTSIYEASVTCGSSYDGCKVNIDKDKLPSDEYLLQLSQDGKIIAGSVFYVSSASNSSNLILDATTTGNIIKRTYLIPQMANSSDAVDEDLIRSAFDKASRNSGYTGSYDLDEIIYLYYNYLLENSTNPDMVITEMVNKIKSQTVALPVNQALVDYKKRINRILELSNQVSLAQFAEKVKLIVEKIKESKAVSKVLDTLVAYASGGTIPKVTDQLGTLNSVMGFLSEASGSKNALAEMNALITALGQVEAEELKEDVQTNKHLQEMSSLLKRSDAKKEIRDMRGDIDLIETSTDVLRNILKGMDLDAYIYKNTQVSPKLEFGELTALYSISNNDGVFNISNLKSIQSAVNRIVADMSVKNMDEFLDAVDTMYEMEAKDGVNVIPIRRAHNLVLSNYSLQIQKVLAYAELVQKNALFLEYKYPYYKGKVVPTEKLDPACNSGSDEQQYECKVKDISARYKKYREDTLKKFKSHYIDVTKDIYGAERLVNPASPYETVSCDFTSLIYKGVDDNGARIPQSIGAACNDGTGTKVSSTLMIRDQKCNYTSGATTSLMNVNGQLACVSEDNRKKSMDVSENWVFTYYHVNGDSSETLYLGNTLPVNFIVKNSAVNTVAQFESAVGLEVPGTVASGNDEQYSANSIGNDVHIDRLSGSYQAFRIDGSNIGTLPTGRDSYKRIYIPLNIKVDGAYYPLYLYTVIDYNKGYRVPHIKSVNNTLACMTNNCEFAGHKYQQYSSVRVKGHSKNVLVRIDTCGADIGDLVYDHKTKLPNESQKFGSICIYATPENK